MAESVEDRYIQRALTVLRVSEGEAGQVAQIMDQFHRQIIREVRREYDGKLTKAAARRIKSAAVKLARKFYGTDFPKEIQDISETIIQKEILWNYDELQNLKKGLKLAGEAAEIVVPVKESVLKRIERKTYQGHTFDFWVKKEFRSNSKKIKKVIDKGYAYSQSISEIESEVSRIAKVSTRNAKTIIRSNIAHAQEEAKSAVFGLNESIVEGAIWRSTLDNRTTWDICGPRDGLLYDNERNPVGHSLPWDAGPGRIHWNCRSTSIPKIQGIDSVTPRASVDAGENYERGDNLTRTGRRRRARKNEREKGLFDINQRTTRTRYEGWLKEQSKKNIDFVADVFGSKEKAQLFRDGKATLKELALESPVARPLNRNSL